VDVRRTSLLIVAFVLVLAAPSAFAQTTGGLSGRISDEQGTPLPGVSVEAKGPALQGSRSTVSGGDGRYRLGLLPPGRYSIAFALSGFGKQNLTGVAVGLDNETTLNATLRLAVEAEVTVSGDAPVIDPTSASIGHNLDQRQVETLPTGRNYSAVAQTVPGVSSDANSENSGQSTISIYGSAGNENVFYIDGVNTTGSEYGFQGKELNYEFIQAVDVKTGGYEAEYGRSTGGIINVVTKSGGNEFHGDVFGYFDNDSLQRTADATVSTGGTITGYTRKDFGIDLGGYFIKDRLWFFGAFDKVKNSAHSALPAGPLAGQEVESKSDRDLAAAKLTFKATPSHSLIGTFFQDPRDDTGAISDAQHSLDGDPLTYDGVRRFGGHDFALRYEGLLGGSFLASAQYARHEEENSVGPATSAGDVIQQRDVSADFYQTGGFGLIQDKKFKRDSVALQATGFFKAHEIKLGFEYEHEKADVVRRFSGGQQVDVYPNPANPARPIFRHSYWTTPDATVANAPVSQLTASPAHKVYTLYLQDRWQVLSNLTLSAGVRWDRQQIIDASGVKDIDLKKDVAPRFGFVWDPLKDGRTKVYGSYGHYYEQLPMDLVIRSFSFERQPRIYNFSPTGVTPDPVAEGLIDDVSAIVGGFTEPADPDMGNQYMREFLFGAEREVARDLAVGIKYIHRDYAQVIEDFLCANDGTYCIGNPAESDWTQDGTPYTFKRIFTLDYASTFPAPEPKRVYHGVQLDLTKRFSNNWYALASYVWSKLDGNFDGLYAPFTNVGADPNISAAYDYYDFFTNGRDLDTITNTGPLSNDRRHQFKVSGIYVTPFHLSVGLSAYFRTGTPVTRYGYSDAYGRYEFFLTRRGAEGRTPDTYDADLHLGYPLKAGPVTVNLLLDVFNLLNTQRPLLLDERWGFAEADNASPVPANPNYKQAALRTPPTSLRLGLRISY